MCNTLETSCRRASATICPRPSPPPWAPKRLARPSRLQVYNIAAPTNPAPTNNSSYIGRVISFYFVFVFVFVAVSHGQHVPTATAAAACRATTVVSKAAW